MRKEAKVDGGRDAGAESDLIGMPGPAERVFARRMKRERQRRGWRQEDLATRLAEASVDLHPSTIAKMEREPDPDKGITPRMIRLNEAFAISRALRLSIDQMLTDDDLTDPAREIEQLRRALADARAEREHTREHLLHTEHRLTDIEHRLHEASDVVRTREDQRRRAAAEGGACVQQRGAETESQTTAVEPRAAAIHRLLRNKTAPTT